MLDDGFKVLYSVTAGIAVAAILFQSSVTSDVQRPMTGANMLDRPDPLLAEAQSLVQTGRLGNAEQAVRRYLESHSNSADAHFLLGYILFKKVNAKASLAEYTEGAKYRVPSAFDLKVVACDYVLLKDYLHADQWFTKSVEWNPKDFQAWYYLGRTKYNENRFEEAIRAFTECLKLDPTDVKAEDNLGLSYAGLGRTNEAMAAFRNAIAWQSKSPVKDPGPFIDLGTLLVDNNRLDEAIAYLLQAEEIAPGESRVHRELGKAYLRLNQSTKAQVELEKAVQLAPQDASLHFILGQVYRKQGQGEKAKLEFDRYAALNKPDVSREAPAH
jgi:Flp pilus assembly protein TadD